MKYSGTEVPRLA
jgi:spermidine/putrescine transport system permease protein